MRETYHYAKHNILVKSYGSMTSNLAIDSSDVDLAIVGFDFKEDKEAMIKEMRQLFCRLHITYSWKQDLEFIDSATVPVIKLKVDLEKISRWIEK